MALCCVAVAVFLLTRGGIGGLSGSAGVGFSSNVPTRVGEAGDFTGFLSNRSGQTITLESATMLPQKGFRTPRFMGAMIELGKGFYIAAYRWPPAKQPKADVPLAALRGFRLMSGHRAQILYGVVGDRPGEYAARGVTVKVRAGSEQASVAVISLGGICVSTLPPKRQHPCSNAFNQRLVRNER